MTFPQKNQSLLSIINTITKSTKKNTQLQTQISLHDKILKLIQNSQNTTKIYNLLQKKIDSKIITKNHGNIIFMFNSFYNLN